jgi:hypothetical protein
MSDELDDYREGAERDQAREDEHEQELALADAPELADIAAEQDETRFDETRLAYSGVEEGDATSTCTSSRKRARSSTTRSARHRRRIFRGRSPPPRTIAQNAAPPERPETHTPPGDAHAARPWVPPALTDRDQSDGSALAGVDDRRRHGHHRGPDSRSARRYRTCDALVRV